MRHGTCIPGHPPSTNLMQTVEIALMLFIIYQCFIHRKKWIALFSIAQTALMLWVEQDDPAGGIHP